MDILLEAHKLTKHYRALTAVDQIDLQFKRGQCFGLLGPNGAGKTTTIEMLEDITPPSSGQVLYKGKPLNQQFRQQTGIMFQNTALQDFITTAEILEFFRDLYDTPASLEELIERCTLSDFLQREVKQLSGGQKQRVLLALSLINNPELIFLDEPTTGLDPQSRRNFWALIKDIKADNKTIILTTHYMDEAQQLCDEIAIIDHGKIIEQGHPTALLKKHFSGGVVELPSSNSKEILHHIYGEVEYSHGRSHIETLDVNRTLHELLDAGISLSGLQVRNHTLDDLFIKLTGKALRN